MLNPTQETFTVQPSIKSVEEFLKQYQKLHATGILTEMTVHVDDKFQDLKIGYVDLERNCYLTLRYAIEQVNAAYAMGESKVFVKLKIGANLS